MKEKKDYFPVILGVLLGLMAALLLLALSNYGAYAEALPSPDTAALIKLDGDMVLSNAPDDLYIVDCVRVDVVRIGNDGIWGDLTLPYVPPSIWAVVLFDGWNLLYGDCAQTGDHVLRVHFWPEDLTRLDGTVGLFLLILAE